MPWFMDRMRHIPVDRRGAGVHLPPRAPRARGGRGRVRLPRGRDQLLLHGSAADARGRVAGPGDRRPAGAGRDLGHAAALLRGRPRAADRLDARRRVDLAFGAPMYVGPGDDLTERTHELGHRADRPARGAAAAAAPPAATRRDRDVVPGPPRRPRRRPVSRPGARRGAVQRGHPELGTRPAPCFDVPATGERPDRVDEHVEPARDRLPGQEQRQHRRQQRDQDQRERPVVRGPALEAGELARSARRTRGTGRPRASPPPSVENQRLGAWHHGEERERPDQARSAATMRIAIARRLFGSRAS